MLNVILPTTLILGNDINIADMNDIANENGS